MASPIPLRIHGGKLIIQLVISSTRDCTVDAEMGESLMRQVIAELSARINAGLSRPDGEQPNHPIRTGEHHTVSYSYTLNIVRGN